MMCAMVMACVKGPLFVFQGLLQRGQPHR